MSLDKRLLKYSNSFLEKMPLKVSYENIPSNLKRYFITENNNISIPSFTKIKSIDEIEEKLIKNCIFLLLFETDDEYIYHLDKILKNNGKFTIFKIYDKHFKEHNYMWTNHLALKTFNDVLLLNNDYFSKKVFKEKEMLQTLIQCIEITKDVEGDYIEIGVLLGSSACMGLTYMQNANINRNSYFLDTYEGFNYNEASESADIHWNNTHKYGEANDIIKQITNNLSHIKNNNFKLIKNNICNDDLPKDIKKIALANIDVDMLEAVEAALQKVAPLITRKGIIICEDATSVPGLIGAYYAMEKFLKTELGKKFIKLYLKSQYVLIKVDD